MNNNINNKKLSFKEELALVLAKYTNKIIKEGDVDPTVHYQILELIEKRIDEFAERDKKIMYGCQAEQAREKLFQEIKELLLK